MIETLKEVREALEDLKRQYGEHPDAFWDWTKARAAITKLDALIAAQEKAEPVAYIQGTALFWPDCAPIGEPDCEPLYTAPQPAPSTSPLTPKQRVSIADASVNFDFDDNFTLDIGKIVDMVEAAHKIGAKL